MAHAPNDLLAGLLKDVSRSFYLTLRVLPKSIRSQIGLAYLLARTTDTIADTELVSIERRLELLQQFSARIAGKSEAPLDFGELARQQGLPAERVLLEKCEASLALLNGFSEMDQQMIRDVLATITSGQELDLRRFANASAMRLIALQNETELDDYTYRVAGCVGEFWTKMCRAHVFPNKQLNDEKFLNDGVRFGKGLQLVNILRDLPRDLRNGRCYLPGDELSSLGLNPTDLLEPANEPKFRPLYNHHLDAASAHLAAGWNYTNTVPRTRLRIRLACAWPVLIGQKTIARLRTGNVLDPRERIKITRSEVRSILLKTIVASPFPNTWRKLGANSQNI
jgi:farnesyl-diphosphate farnesyltransferase